MSGASSTVGETAAGRGQGPTGSWLELVAVTLVVALAAVRVVVGFAVTGVEDVGAGLGGGGGTVGRTGTAVADVLSVLTLGIVLADRVRRGAGLHRVLVGLWAVGAVGAAASGWARGDPSMALVWIGATALGLAAMHLADRAGARRIMIAAVVGLCVPLAVEAVFQVTYLHGQTVARYEQEREAIAAARGWSAGASAQRKFEQRIYENTATGMFGLANVFAGVLVGCALVAGGLTAGFAARRGEGGPARWGACLTGACVVLALAGVALTRSKGAGGSLVIGSLAIAGACWAGRRWRRPGWLPAVTAVGVVLAAGVAIGARGWMGPPETAEGERSLLFRWYYVEAAGRMFLDSPGLGVGPGGFQSVYARMKNPLSPEDVALPHNVFAAWGASMGVAGLAWAAMLMGMLGRAGRRVGQEAWQGVEGVADEASEVGTGDGARTRWAIAGIAGAGVFGVKFATGFSAFAGVALAIGAMMGMGWWLSWRVGRGGWPVAGGMIALVVAAVGCSPLLLPSVGVWAVGAAGFVMLTGWVGGAMRRASSRWVGAGLVAAATAIVLHAQIDMGLTNVMSAPLLMVIVGLAAGGRVRRSPRRCQRSDAWVGIVAGFVLPVSVALGARGVVDPYVSPTQRAWQEVAAVMVDWRVERTEAKADAVMEAVDEWLALRPYNIEAHRRASELAAELGRTERAAAWLARALALDERAYLDPNSQLTEERRRRLEQRLERWRQLDSPSGSSVH